MKEVVRMIEEIGYNDKKTKEDLLKLFMSKFMMEALFDGGFFWAMSDEKEALRVYGHQEIGWFNDKTEKYREAHPNASEILRERIIWSSNNPNKVSFDFMPAKTSHQLVCAEMKLKQGEFPMEQNFYLKIGMIPVWNDDYSKIVDYLGKPVVDFHD